MLKIIAPFHFVDDRPKSESLAHWNERHPDVVKRCIPGALQYVQNVPISTSKRSWSFDAVSELWFEDMDAIKVAFGDEDLQRELHADEDLFAKREELWLIVDERKIW